MVAMALRSLVVGKPIPPLASTTLFGQLAFAKAISRVGLCQANGLGAMAATARYGAWNDARHARHAISGNASDGDARFAGDAGNDPRSAGFAGPARIPRSAVPRRRGLHRSWQKA